VAASRSSARDARRRPSEPDERAGGVRRVGFVREASGAGAAHRRRRRIRVTHTVASTGATVRQAKEELVQGQTVRRKPRYVLGTFWMLLGLSGIIGGIGAGNLASVLVGVLAALYSVYLYRGGRFGLIVW
jgi:hypothetical protein